MKRQTWTLNNTSSNHILVPEHVGLEVHVGTLGEFMPRCGGWTLEETMIWVEEEVQSLEDGEEAEKP